MFYNSKALIKQGLVVYIFYPSTGETEERGSPRVQGQPGPSKEFQDNQGHCPLLLGSLSKVLLSLWVKTTVFKWPAVFSASQLSGLMTPSLPFLPLGHCSNHIVLLLGLMASHIPV